MNVKRTCTEIDPAGTRDVMCELIIDTPATLRMLDVIKAQGTYIVAGWIWTDVSTELQFAIGNTSRDIQLSPGWNRVQLTVEATAPGSVYIRFKQQGIYRIYRLQINDSDKLCAYSGESLIKPVVFGICNENMERVIYNESDNEIGFICRMHFNDKVTDPKIYISGSGYIEITGDYRKDEILEIDTRTGHKSVKSIYHMIERNLINKRTTQSKWLLLEKGINHIGHTAASGAEHISTQIIYSNEYEGV